MDAAYGMETIETGAAVKSSVSGRPDLGHRIALRDRLPEIFGVPAPRMRRTLEKQPKNEKRITGVRGRVFSARATCALGLEHWAGGSN